jgi:hypothetical protein
LFPVHTPVQHSDAVAAVQGSSSCLQAVAPQTLPVQSSVQHSPAEVQLAPCGLQNSGFRQTGDAPLQMPEQQPLASGSHDAPSAWQTTVGEAQTPGVPADVSQRPEQQSSGAVQEAVSAAHSPAGFVQTPFAQAFVQQ